MMNKLHLCLVHSMHTSRICSRLHPCIYTFYRIQSFTLLQQSFYSLCSIIITGSSLAPKMVTMASATHFLCKALTIVSLPRLGNMALKVPISSSVGALAPDLPVIPLTHSPIAALVLPGSPSPSPSLSSLPLAALGRGVWVRDSAAMRPASKLRKLGLGAPSAPPPAPPTAAAPVGNPARSPRRWFIWPGSTLSDPRGGAETPINGLNKRPKRL